MDKLDSLLQSADSVNRLAEHVRGGAPAGFLRSIKIKIISSCNLRCQMCKYWRIAKERLPAEAVGAALESAASLGCAKVHFSGGEVTLHPELTRLIERAAGLGMRVNLTSNGVLLDKQRAREWLRAGLRAASFSLDGVRSKTHDRIRGVPGAFRRTVKGIVALRREAERRRAKLTIRINCVLMRENLRELPDLLCLAHELGASDVVPMPIDGCPEELPSMEQIARFNRDVVPRIIELRRSFGMPMDSGRLFPFGRSEREIECGSRGEYAFGYYDRHPCFAPYLHAFVSHTGDVYACCMTRGKIPPLGNIREQSLAEIFVGARYESLRSAMRKRRLPICANCDQFLKENRRVAGYLQGPYAVASSEKVLEEVVP